MFIIYKINKVNYIGCTTNFKKRVFEHNYHRNKPSSTRYHKKLYTYIRNNNIKIELIPLFRYNKKLKFPRIKRLIEQWYIDLFDSIAHGFNEFRAISCIPSSKYKLLENTKKNNPHYSKFYFESLKPIYCQACKRSYSNKYKYCRHIKTFKHYKNNSLLNNKKNLI